MNRVASRLLPLLGLLLLVGCANPWQKSFEPNPFLQGEKFAPTEQLDLRTVEFERLQSYEKQEKELRVKSPTAPQDWPEQERTAAKQRLLTALQLQDKPENIAILGWSRFTETAQLDLRGKELAEFARQIGADVVVTSSTFLGQVNRTVEYPLTSYSTYYTNVQGPRGRYGNTYTGSEHSTTWVPTTVTENQYLYEAVFLRRLSNAPTTRPGS